MRIKSGPAAGWEREVSIVSGESCGEKNAALVREKSWDMYSYGKRCRCMPQCTALLQLFCSERFSTSGRCRFLKE